MYQKIKSYTIILKPNIRAFLIPPPQKIGLLLKMSEDQFAALTSGKIAATPELIEALAVSVETMEEYVRGLQAGRQGMDYLLDRSISDLEVAIGKKVSLCP